MKSKILVVDDDIDLCDLIYQILLDEGYLVDQAYDGKTALQMLSDDNFNLIIIDNKLKGMYGVEVLEKAKIVKPNMKSMMISAYGTPATKSRAKKLGVLDFIDKPFEISKLVESVKKFLN
jgi:DNA-binding NtrC family response regulator